MRACQVESCAGESSRFAQFPKIPRFSPRTCWGSSICAIGYLRIEYVPAIQPSVYDAQQRQYSFGHGELISDGVRAD
jgi:hypothetical protein